MAWTRRAPGGPWVFEAPQDTAITGFDLWRYASVIDASQSARYRLFVDELAIDASPEDAPWEFGTFGAGDVVSRTNFRAARIGVEMACADGVEPCGGDAIHLAVSRAAVTLRDDIAPEAVGVPSGRLFSGLSIDGVVDARLGFRDSGGGVVAVELKVDGVSKGLEEVGGPTCAPPYVVRVPCALAGNVTMVLDTAQLSDGAHTVEFALTDVAGNRSVVGPFGISVRTPTTSNPIGPQAPAPPGSPEAGRLSPAGTLSLVGKRTRRISSSTRSSPADSSPQTARRSSINASRYGLVRSAEVLGAHPAASPRTPRAGSRSHSRAARHARCVSPTGTPRRRSS